MDGEKIDAEAVEAWRPPVADAATDDDGGQETGKWVNDGRHRAADAFLRTMNRWLDVVSSDDALDFVADPAEPDDLDLNDIDDCDSADDEPDFVRDWVDED